MQRGRAFRRWKRLFTINRKVRLLRRIGGDENVQAWTHDAPGRLSKGKIHCSCPVCREKSYDQVSHSDAKQKVFASSQMFD